MLAQRMPTILPPLDDAAAMEVTSLYSIAGRLPAGAGLQRRPPFQAPHHTSSVSALVGGGSGVARPGALSLAHRGVLFLDEVPRVHPVRPGNAAPAAGGRRRTPGPLPRDGELSGAGPVGHRGESVPVCPPRRRSVLRVRTRRTPAVSEPAVRTADGSHRHPGRALPGDVGRALQPIVGRRIGEDRRSSGGRPSHAAERWHDQGWRSNAEAGREALALPPAATRDLRHRIDAGLLSARGYVRVLRVAWSIADLAGRTSPDRDDVTTALGLRMGRLG